MNTLSAPFTTQTSTPAGASTQGDDLLALIKAIRLLWKHKRWIAPGTILFTARTIR